MLNKVRNYVGVITVTYQIGVTVIGLPDFCHHKITIFEKKVKNNFKKMSNELPIYNRK